MDAEVRTPRLSVAALLFFHRVPGERTHTTHTRKKWKTKRKKEKIGTIYFLRARGGCPKTGLPKRIFKRTVTTLNPGRYGALGVLAWCACGFSKVYGGNLHPYPKRTVRICTLRATWATPTLELKQSGAGPLWKIHYFE